MAYLNLAPFFAVEGSFVSLPAELESFRFTFKLCISLSDVPATFIPQFRQPNVLNPMRYRSTSNVV